MSGVSTILESLLAWLPAFLALLTINGGIAWWGKPLKVLRYPLALLVALCPLLTPSGLAYAAPWGMLSTVLTTFVIVSAARLPDWDHFARTQRRPLERFLWLTLPMLRGASSSPLTERWPRAKRFFSSGCLKIFIWQVLFWGAQGLPIEAMPWPIKSALLMLFFVLNLTATSDLLSGVCLWLGYEVDLLFDSPLLSETPRDFWSRRWNRFIGRFALKHVALKLPRRSSDLILITSVFAVSGLFHEYFAWSVGGSRAAHGFMTLFFLIQGLAVWLGTKLPPLSFPRSVGNALCFVWMSLTAPLFFRAVEPALLAFSYPKDWLPF